MKSIFLILVLSFSVNALEWEIEAEKNGYQYRLSASKEISVVFDQVAVGVPEFLRVQDHSHLEIVIVYMGDVGTQCSTIVQNAFVFNKKTKKFLGEFPYLRENCGAVQVKWKYFKDKIEVRDPNTDQFFTIKF